MDSREPTNPEPPGDLPLSSPTTTGHGGEQSSSDVVAEAPQQNSAETESGGDLGNKPTMKGKVGRKRGRVARASSEKAKPRLSPPQKREKKDEEDVCFICFDGGELVVCDRRSCPKAYHPTCVKRSQSFFRSKAKWNCGWHICTTCQKKAHYMCYSCPHSLCKTCYKNADFVCIRDTKGLCATCRGTIMLIENVNEGNKEMVQVDFDDKLSWEYLFKVYWTDLKEKLSLTVEEITRAKRPQKERKSRSRRIIEKIPNGFTKLGNQQLSYTCGSIGWASKEVLEFVGYMKEGDTSLLSRFDVQALLLEYINRNNLRDPKQKSQISCDMRLVKLFGKASVDHFEMLKLLDSHFDVKETPQTEGIAQGASLDLVGGQMDIDLNKDEQPVLDNDRKLEICAKLDKKDDLIDQNHCEVIDSQGIRSIYVQRNSIENLIDDFDQVQKEVVGSVARIRVSGQMNEFENVESQMRAQLVKTEQVIDESLYPQPGMVNNPVSRQGVEVSTINSWNNAKNQADAISSVTHEAVSGAGSEISPSPLSTGTDQSVNDDETCKIWHYQDTNGKVQGPFTMFHLRKWKTVGQFPLELRVWRNDEKQEDSILLTDALDGQFVKEPQPLHSREEVRLVSDDRDSNLDAVSSISVSTNNNSRSDLSSHFSTQTMKTERQSIEKVCRNVSGGLSETLFSTVGGSQEFNCINGVPSQPERGVGQTPGGSTGKDNNGDSNSLSYSSTQSSGQNWKGPSPVVSSVGNSNAGSLVDSLLATFQQSSGTDVAFRCLSRSAQKPAFESFRSSNVSIGASGLSWSTASSSMDSAVTVNRTVNNDWGSNFPATSQRSTETCTIDGSTLTLGSGQLTPPSTEPPPFSWQAMIMEPEFTSLPEESISDLLAELEASEPLNTSFPTLSPRCSDGTRGGTRNESSNLDASFFSVPVPQLGRVDSFNSRHFLNPSPPAVANEHLGSCYFNLPPQNMNRMISQEYTSTANNRYRDGFPEYGQVNWFTSMERNPDMWQQQQQEQQQTNPYGTGNRSSNPTDQFFGGLNLDIGRGMPFWDRQ